MDKILNTIKNSLNWSIPILFLIIYLITAVKNRNRVKEPIINRLEEINKLKQIELKLDSLKIINQETQILKLQDTIIQRNKIINNYIVKHNERIYEISNLNNDSLLLECKSAIRYLDSLDKSGGFFVLSNSSN